MSKYTLQERTVSPSRRPQRASNRPSLAHDHHSVVEYVVPTKTLTDKYRVETADARGRSVNFSVTMPPEFRRTVSKIVQVGEFGFETEQDCLRWCIYQGLKELQKRSGDPETHSALGLLHTFVAAAREQLAFQQHERSIRIILASADRLCSTKDYAQAEQMIEELRRKADAITDVLWRRKFVDAANDKLHEIRKYTHAHAK